MLHLIIIEANFLANFDLNSNFMAAGGYIINFVIVYEICNESTQNKRRIINFGGK